MGSARISGGSNHLEFVEQPRKIGAKTSVWDVINVRFGEKIGMIHWRGGWRQYVFQALPEVDISRSCMEEIKKFIDFRMDYWRYK